jgi:hypothetical protein
MDNRIPDTSVHKHWTCTRESDREFADLIDLARVLALFPLAQQADALERRLADAWRRADSEVP